MIKKKVESSNISQIGFEAGLLEVTFNSGSTYQYFDVDEKLFEDFLNADSKGKFFYTQVRGQFDYEKLEDKKE